jgi:restriction system protein
VNALDAAEHVLTKVGKPLTAREITEKILARGLWQTQGKTPWATIDSYLAVDIKDHGNTSRFQRCAPSLFALRSWGQPEYVGKPFKKKTQVVREPLRQDAGTDISLENKRLERPVSLSFSDAAEKVLEQYGNRQPMHYQELTKKCLELGLVTTRGQTPAQTMYTQLQADIERYTKRGENGRFIMYGRGMFGLSRWVDVGLAHQIEQHNDDVRRKLRDQLFAMSWSDFQDLIAELLDKVGFVNVSVANLGRDHGIDVRGTLVVAGVIRTNMAVQVKRWRNNVQAPIIQQVRGSLGTHDQGLIITTSDFSSGAKQEAERPNAVPVALMNGEQLVNLLVEYDLGVTRASYDLIELSLNSD